MVYIGIDPGVNGGIAAITDEGRVLTAVPMPELEHEILSALTSSYESAAGPDGRPRWRAMLERVIPFSAPGRTIGTKSSFTSGVGYGRLLMGLTACQIPFDEVMPIKWQNLLGCRTGGDKNVSKRRAIQLFPAVPRITHATADALLIAEYARRVHGQTSSSVLMGRGHVSA